ncbi:hypothetical protein [Candidatus Regiella insecticola]|uniref:hypothetical protein n=1 Tax=Candidatus Regiella insecticola TaxID=138073 RepID=UPI001ED909A4|nr:hypothetical protein [Candidatus Regiella insecticola]
MSPMQYEKPLSLGLYSPTTSAFTLWRKDPDTMLSSSAILLHQQQMPATNVSGINIDTGTPMATTATD